MIRSRAFFDRPGVIRKLRKTANDENSLISISRIHASDATGPCACALVVSLRRDECRGPRVRYLEKTTRAQERNLPARPQATAARFAVRDAL
jgi:hypothetical protein